MNINNITTKNTAAVPTAKDREKQELKKACQDFESVFLSQMLKGMRSTVQKSDLFGSGKEEQIWQDMMDQEFCKNAAKTQGIGIADVLFNQLSKQLTNER